MNIIPEASKFHELADTLVTASALALTVTADELAGASLEGSADVDTLQLTGGGTFDLTQAAVFTSIEIVRGSDQHDTIIVDPTIFAGITTFNGGASPATHLDEIVLRGAVFDFTGKSLVGIDRLVLQTDNAVLIVPDLDTALLASGIASQNDRLEVRSVTLTDAQIRTLHRQGIDTVVDALGDHVNTAPVISRLQGERITASVAQTVFIDVDRNALIADDDGAFSLLNVTALRSLDAPGRLSIDTAGAVTLEGGYTSGSLVKVNGVEVGMLWDAGDASISIAFNGTSATPERVQEIVRAITYTTAATPPQASTEQTVTVTLTDAGGRQAEVSMIVEQDAVIEPPKIILSHASIPELARDGTFIGLLSTRMLGAGDAFTYTLLDDAGHRFAIQGDRLVVAQGSNLDYEQQASHTITVRATSTDGRTLDQTFTIALEDVSDESGTTSGVDGVRETETESGKLLVGGRGDDRLVGGKGADMLYGKGGNDMLRGGENADVFVFDTKPHAKKNKDRISDFDPKADSIWLENKIFKGLGRKGSPEKPAPLSKGLFFKGAAAHDANDRIGYDPQSGALIYDADGSGAGAAVVIAVLSRHLKGVSHKDIFVV